jgi:hypothetical protein
MSGCDTKSTSNRSKIELHQRKKKAKKAKQRVRRMFQTMHLIKEQYPKSGFNSEKTVGAVVSGTVLA